MSRLFKLLSIAAIAFLAVLAAQPPQKAGAAFGSYMCAPDAWNTAAGARTIGGTLSQVPSGTIYVLNGQGCAFIANQDVGYFLSQGFTGGQNFFTASVTALTANSAAGTPFLTLPAGVYIHNIVLAETANNAVTGGVDIGTASAGQQVVAAATLSGNGLVVVLDAALLKRVFGTGPAPAAQGLWYTCHTGCNSSSVNISVMYSYF